MFDKQTYEGTKNLYTQMLHGEETKGQVYDILKEENVPPPKRVAEVSKMVTQQANQVLKRNGKIPEAETVIGSSLYLASDILDIAKAGGFFEVNKENAPQLVEASNKAAYQQSIKDQILDPVKLQELLNEQMPEGYAKAGLSNEATPDEADETVAMEQYALKRERRQAEEAQAKAERTPAQAMAGRQEATNGIG